MENKKHEVIFTKKEQEVSEFAEAQMLFQESNEILDKMTSDLTEVEKEISLLLREKKDLLNLSNNLVEKTENILNIDLKLGKLKDSKKRMSYAVEGMLKNSRKLIEKLGQMGEKAAELKKKLLEMDNEEHN